MIKHNHKYTHSKTQHTTPPSPHDRRHQQSYQRQQRRRRRIHHLLSPSCSSANTSSSPRYRNGISTHQQPTVESFHSAVHSSINTQSATIEPAAGTNSIRFHLCPHSPNHSNPFSESTTSSSSARSVFTSTTIRSCRCARSGPFSCDVVHPGKSICGRVESNHVAAVSPM